MAGAGSANGAQVRERLTGGLKLKETRSVKSSSATTLRPRLKVGGAEFVVAILKMRGQFVEYFRFSFRAKTQSS